MGPLEACLLSLCGLLLSLGRPMGLFGVPLLSFTKGDICRRLWIPAFLRLFAGHTSCDLALGETRNAAGLPASDL